MAKKRVPPYDPLNEEWKDENTIEVKFTFDNEAFIKSLEAAQKAFHNYGITWQGVTKSFKKLYSEIIENGVLTEPELREQLGIHPSVVILDEFADWNDDGL